MFVQRLALAAAAALLGSGCSLVVSDVGDFDEATGDAGGVVADSGGNDGEQDTLEAAACGDGFTLCVELTKFTPHVNETLELTLARGPSLRARAILDPLTYPDNSDEAIRGARITFSLANAMRNSNAAGEDFEVLFFADHDPDMDGVFTPPPDRPDAPFPDHAWRFDVPEDGQLNFEHAADFSDLTDNPPRNLEGDFNLTIQGMTSHTDETLHVWVINTRPPERTVGYYRKQKIPQQRCNPSLEEDCSAEDLNPFTISLPGILDAGQAYRVEFFADHEINQVYDSPPLDHSWAIEFEAEPTGFDIDFIHTGEFDEVTPPPDLRK